jgi:hypothetical protein
MGGGDRYSQCTSLCTWAGGRAPDSMDDASQCSRGHQRVYVTTYPADDDELKSGFDRVSAALLTILSNHRTNHGF